MNELSLFSGIGGGILGSVLLGWRTICAVEKDSYCREVLLGRQADRLLPLFPIWEDVRTFDGKEWRGVVDIVTAGFPCQPFSVAGKRKGEADERNMWPDTIRIIREVRPRYALLENVPGLLATRYFGRILGDISESGYDAEWDVISAADVGAPHLRKRLWILLADADRKNLRIEPRRSHGANGKDKTIPANDGYEEHVADSESGGANGYGTIREPNGKASCRRRSGNGSDEKNDLGNPNGSRRIKQRWSEPAQQEQQAIERAGWWESEPDVGRVVDGVSFRVDQLKGLGNAQVPAVVVRAWETLRRRHG